MELYLIPYFFILARNPAIGSFKVMILCLIFPYARADLPNQGISQVTKGENWADFSPQPEQMIYSKHAANQSFEEGTTALPTWQKNVYFLKKTEPNFYKGG